MAKAAKSISADKLAALTRDAVKAVPGAKGTFVGKGPIMGFILQSNLSPAGQLDLATQITDSITQAAGGQGVSGLKPKPVVVTRPGQITVGFIAPELGIKIR